MFLLFRSGQSVEGHDWPLPHGDESGVVAASRFRPPSVATGLALGHYGRRLIRGKNRCKIRIGLDLLCQTYFDLQYERAHLNHETTREQGVTCMDCRFGSAHIEPDGTSTQELFGAHK